MEEETTSTDAPGGPAEGDGAPRYAAFISYSHAADSRLAIALQHGLETFTKPWNRLRALRVFRDQASLSAAPGLWTAIEAALGSSEFFILMASPEAAQSPWVARELAWWREHRSCQRILLVLTDGDLTWDADARDFDWTRTNVVPPPLREAFTEEPRWVDLRWAREEAHPSLRHPAFRECVADLAAPLHGRPKDELIGQDVEEHRRAMRLARGAGASLALLTLLAVLAAILAVAQRDVAKDRARVATSRQLAAQALALLDDRIDQSVLLSLAALRVEDTVEARGALLAGIERSPHLRAFLHGSERGAGTDTDAYEGSFSPDGRTLVSTGRGSVVLWDTQTLEPRRRLATGAVTGTAFGPDSRVLATAGDGGLVLWETATGRPLGRPLTGDRMLRVAFSPDGRTLASAGDDGLLLWDAGTGLQQGEPLIREHVFGIAFSPDGRTLASVGEGGVVLWDVPTRRPVGERLTTVTGASVAFSPDGRMLAATLSLERVSEGRLAKGAVLLWDTGTHRLLAQLPTPSPFSVAFSPDGRTVAWAGEGGIALWDVRTGQPLRLPEDPFTKDVARVSFSPDGRALVLGGDILVLWDIEARAPLGERLSDAPGVVMASSPDGQILASGDKTAGLALWDTRNRKLLTTLLPGRSVSGVTFSPDGRMLAAVSQGELVLWDLGDLGAFRQLEPLPGESSVNAVAYSPDRGTLALAGYEGEGVTLADATSRTPLGTPLTSNAVSNVAFSSDGRTLATSGDEGLVLWDVSSRRQKGKPLTGTLVYAMAFSPDGGTLASSDGNGLVLWDLGTGPPRERLTTDPAESVAFSPDGRMLAAGGSDGLALWDVGARQQLGRLPAGNVLAVAFSSDGRTLASAGQGGLVVWTVSLQAWQERACTIANRNLTASEWIRFMPSGTRYERLCP